MFKRLQGSIQKATSSFSASLRTVKKAFERCIDPFLHCNTKHQDGLSNTQSHLEEQRLIGPQPHIENPEEKNLRNRTQGDLFLFLQVLGRGAYGSVFKLRDEDSKETYAYKLSDINSKFLNNAFYKEVYALRQLEGHKNIVQFVCCDAYGKEAGILMEFVEHNMKEILILRDKQEFKLKPSWIKSIIRDLLTAVSHIHSNGIIHFDLKPQNLLITRSGVLKVADFGLSEQRKDRPFSSLKVTQPYRPPECYLNRSLIDNKADLWSCGVIILELITGKGLVPPSRGRENRLRLLASAYKLTGDPFNALCNALQEENSPMPKLDTALQRGKWASAAWLTQRLLLCNPGERIEAEEALLNASYFFEKPWPTPPDLSCLG